VISTCPLGPKKKQCYLQRRAIYRGTFSSGNANPTPKINGMLLFTGLVLFRGLVLFTGFTDTHLNSAKRNLCKETHKHVFKFQLKNSECAIKYLFIGFKLLRSCCFSGFCCFSFFLIAQIFLKELPACC
jgi:hypothetical protein